MSNEGLEEDLHTLTAVAAGHYGLEQAHLVKRGPEGGKRTGLLAVPRLATAIALVRLGHEPKVVSLTLGYNPDWYSTSWRRSDKIGEARTGAFRLLRKSGLYQRVEARRRASQGYATDPARLSTQQVALVRSNAARIAPKVDWQAIGPASIARRLGVSLDYLLQVPSHA
jgi:hypothetical protein